MHILLIGPLPPPVGGSSILFSELVNDLKRDSRVDPQVINTARGRRSKNWLVNITVAVKTLWLALFSAPGIDVISFHASRRAMLLYGPVMFCVARLFDKPLVLRLFGGAFEEEYEAIGPVGRWVIDRTVLASDIMLFETKRLVAFFQQRGTGRVEWFSNYTRQVDLSKRKRCKHKRCEKFIFLGRIQEVKGIGILLEAAPYLNPSLVVDVYGPLYEPYTAEMINSNGQSRVRYKGVLATEQVQEMLFEYDALVLPTFHKSEGYPAVILEAYSHGLPVIATKWRSIPEIVDESSGILIPPRAPTDLADAMNRLLENPKLFRQLQRGAIGKRSLFSDGYWTNRFIELCQEVVLRY